MSTYERELTAQCAAVVEVLQAARVPCVVPDGGQAPDAFLSLRPALRALRVSCVDQRWIEQHIREEPERYHTALAQQGGPRILVVQLEPFLQMFAVRGRHRVCITYTHWHIEVLGALMHHGYYDPETNHTPPAERQLDAIERREEGRGMLNQLMPGMGDFLSGHRPTEGREHFGYIRTDEDGNHYFI